jgi:hypothetical protein
MSSSATALSGSYDYLLVALSVVIAILAPMPRSISPAGSRPREARSDYCASRAARSRWAWASGRCITSAARDGAYRARHRRIGTHPQALHRQVSFKELLQSVAVAANEATSLEAALQFAIDRICAHTRSAFQCSCKTKSSRCWNSFRTRSRIWLDRMPNSNSSRTWPRMTCRNRCGWSRASLSCSLGSIKAGWMPMRTNTFATPPMARSECRY